MKTLVVYYSRTGYTKKGALEIAQALDADVYEINDGRKRRGPFGFLSAIRDISKSRVFPIWGMKGSVSDYDQVIVCTPVWAGQMSTPVRSFLLQHGSDIPRASYLIARLMPQDYTAVAREMDKLIGKQHDRLFIGVSQNERFLEDCRAFGESLRTLPDAPPAPLPEEDADEPEAD